jgi:carbonic anhydrase
LDTKLIVVLGHESCGAVTAAMKLPENPPGHVVTLINSIKPASLKTMKEGASEKEQLAITVEANVVEQVKLLRGLEPVLSRMYDVGDLVIVGAV